MEEGVAGGATAHSLAHETLVRTRPGKHLRSRLGDGPGRH